MRLIILWGYRVETFEKIQAIEGQLTQIGTQELSVRQRELETKMSRLLKTSDLPSFGHDSSSKSSTSLELRLMEMETSHENLDGK